MLSNLLCITCVLFNFVIGEGGEAVFISMEEKDASEKSIREYGFNMVASDKIAMDRTIPDTRMAE